MSLISASTGVISKASAIRTGLIVAAVALSIGFAGGWKVHGWSTAKVELRATKAELRDVARETKRRHAIGVQHAQDQRDIEVFYEQQMPDWWRTFVAERPGLADVGVGNNGLCVWNAWNAGAAGRDRPCVARQSGAVAGSDERPIPGLGGEPSPGDEAIPPDRDAAQRTDRRGE